LKTTNYMAKIRLQHLEEMAPVIMMYLYMLLIPNKTMRCCFSSKGRKEMM
jgi:hypothetical protein